MPYFAAILRMKAKETNTILPKISAITMILMLLWLTVSAPFVFAAQQELAKQENRSCTTSPLAASEEESKAPSGTSFSEEFLHHHDKAELFAAIIKRSHGLENADTYHAFHGEQLVPPPDVA